MTTGQWRVTGLILVLLVLELIVNPGLHGFLSGIWGNFNAALNNASGGKKQ